VANIINPCEFAIERGNTLSLDVYIVLCKLWRFHHQRRSHSAVLGLITSGAGFAVSRETTRSGREDRRK
jgi:hypothetical protein